MACAYCLKDDSKPKDHVPPRTIFPKSVRMSLQNNLIKVSCCSSCNQKFAQGLDPNFKVLLGLRVGAAPDSTNPIMQEYFKEMLSTLSNGKQKLRQKLIKQIIQVNNNAPCGCPRPLTPRYEFVLQCRTHLQGGNNVRRFRGVYLSRSGKAEP